MGLLNPVRALNFCCPEGVAVCAVQTACVRCDELIKGKRKIKQIEVKVNSVLSGRLSWLQNVATGRFIWSRVQLLASADNLSANHMAATFRRVDWVKMTCWTGLFERFIDQLLIVRPRLEAGLRCRELRFISLLFSE